ncbi:MAG TPA: potassium-transporting ATPase subunit KdpC [Dehalococcoidia bacterium]|nr:potassium-transporting ATPase subunit KdpC [Dehalococcoidia bacterium]
MAKTLVTDFKAAIISMVFFTVLCGLAYPLLITGIAQGAFPRQANGSIVKQDGEAVGSSLVGQSFSGPEYFHARPSGAGADGYDGGASSGSNLGPSSQALVDRVSESLASVRDENDLDSEASVPVDAVTASGSGLDPHISPAYAELQIARVASERRMTEDEVRSLVKKFTDGSTFLVLGEPRVNVLRLNLALDAR